MTTDGHWAASLGYTISSGCQHVVIVMKPTLRNIRRQASTGHCSVRFCREGRNRLHTQNQHMDRGVVRLPDGSVEVGPKDCLPENCGLLLIS